MLAAHCTKNSVAANYGLFYNRISGQDGQHANLSVNPTVAASAGTKLPMWDRKTIKATCRRKIINPPNVVKEKKNKEANQI